MPGPAPNLGAAPPFCWAFWVTGPFGVAGLGDLERVFCALLPFDLASVFCAFGAGVSSSESDSSVMGEILARVWRTARLHEAFCIASVRSRVANFVRNSVKTSSYGMSFRTPFTDNERPVPVTTRPCNSKTLSRSNKLLTVTENLPFPRSSIFWAQFLRIP